MSMDAYTVAVKLKLTDLVTTGLSIVGRGLRDVKRDADGVQSSLSGIERQLRSIRNLGLAGGALAGAGAFGLSMFEAPLKAAREYELAFTKFKTMNLGSVVNAQADQFARSANLMGISAKDLMHTMSESVGLFGSFSEAQKLTPKIAALNAANAAIFGGKIDGIDAGASRSLAKFIDRRGGTKDEGSFLRNLDLAQKLVTGSGGFIKFRDLDQFSQQGGTAFRGLSDAGVLNMAMLLQEQGGARAGTAMMSMYQNLIAGRSTKAAGHAVVSAGLGTMVEQVIGTAGGRPQTRSHLQLNPAFAAALQADPVSALRDFMLPAIQKRFGSGDDVVLKVVNDMLSNRTASGQASIITTQLAQVMRDANLTKGAMGYQATIDAWKNDPNSKFSEMHARWTDTMRELGMVVLPVAVKGVEALTVFLKSAIEFGQHFPKLTQGVVLAGAALSGLAAVGGTLMLATAGFKALQLALGVGAVAGGAGLLGAVSAVLGPIALLAGALGGLVLIANALRPDSKDESHPGSHWVPGKGRSGAGGHWEANARFVGARTGAAGWEDWDEKGSRFVPRGGSGGGRPIHATITMPDGKVLARVVTQEQERELSRPQSGLSGFDGRRNLSPAGGAAGH